MNSRCRADIQCGSRHFHSSYGADIQSSCGADIQSLCGDDIPSRVEPNSILVWSREQSMRSRPHSSYGDDIQSRAELKFSPCVEQTFNPRVERNSICVEDDIQCGSRHSSSYGADIHLRAALKFSLCGSRPFNPCVEPTFNLVGSRHSVTSAELKSVLVWEADIQSRVGADFNLGGRRLKLVWSRLSILWGADIQS